MSKGDLPAIVDSRFKPASKLGEYEINNLPDDYDDTKHGPPPLFMKYRGMAEKLMEAVENGCTQETAAIYVGTTRNTLASWLRKGRRAREVLEEKGPDTLTYWDPYYIALLEMFENKDLERQLKYLGIIEKASREKIDGSWQASAWMLERNWPELYSTKHEIRHAGHEGGAIEHKFTLDLGEKERVVKTDEGEVETLDDADWEIIEEITGEKRNKLVNEDG